MATKKRKNPAVVESSYQHETSIGARIEKIRNGFLSHAHHSGPKGYHSETNYHRTDPTKRIGSILANLKRRKS